VDMAEVAADAAREIWLRVRAEGLGKGPWGYTQLPAGCESLPAVQRLTRRVCHVFGRPAGTAEPVQLLLRLPDEDTDWAAVQYEPHVDRTPEGGLYERVVGCCLTDAPGGTAVLPGRAGTVGFHAGEVFTWAGDVLHHGLLNRGRALRLTAYWRFRK
jgi:hypothetical protein